MKKSEVQDAEVMSEETGIATLKKFDLEKAELQKMAKDYANLVVTEETLPEAKKVRMTIRDKRYVIQNILKENKAVLNKLKDNQESQAEELIAIIQSTEEKIDAGIKAIENRKAEEKARAEKEERERVAREEAERKAAEEARLKAEAERLEIIRKEQDAKELAFKKAQEEAEVEIKRKQTEVQAEIDRKNAEAKALMDKREAELKAKEEAIQREREAEIKKKQAEVAAQEAKIKAEQEAIEKEKRELEEKRLTEERAKKHEEERIEKERLEKISAEKEAKRLEELKPDKEKLHEFANSLSLIATPNVKDPKAQMIIDDAFEQILQVQEFIMSEVAKLR